VTRAIATALALTSFVGPGVATASITPEGPFGSGAGQVWLLRPAGPVRGVVVFGHGWKLQPPSPSSAWVAQFAPWLEHLVSEGEAVIFPRYQLGGDRPGLARVASYRKGVTLGFRQLRAPDAPVVVAGYSYGGSLAFSYAANARQWGLPAVRAVDAVFPSGPVPGAPLPPLSSSVRVVIQVGDQDTEAGARGANAFWRWLARHPKVNRHYVIVRSRPGFVANHAAPKLATPAAQRAFWAPLDALLPSHG
jgi:dienelactone hydrolase